MSMCVEKVVDLGDGYSLTVRIRDTKDVDLRLNGPHDVNEWLYDWEGGMFGRGSIDWTVERLPQAVAHAIQRVTHYKDKIAEAGDALHGCDAVAEIWKEMPA